MNRGSDDAALVERAVAGDHGAFGELVEAYQGLVFTVAQRIVRDRRVAEELLQETFLKAFRKLATLKDRVHFKAWLVQIATNESLRAIRRKDPAAVTVDFSDERSATLFRDEARELSLLGVEEAAQKVMDLDRIGVALDALPLTYRTPIILRYYAGLSYKEVAERMDLSLAATKFRLHYGIRLLKALVVKG